MDTNEMVALIRGGVAETGGIWADLGAGTGNFTWALAALLGPQAMIHAIDRDARAVRTMQRRLETELPGAVIHPRQDDATHRLNLPPLDGVLMANMLHFVRQQELLLSSIADQIKPGGRLLLVEYEQNIPIPWVPFPVPFARFTTLAESTGFTAAKLVGTRRSPSSGQEMYAAVAEKRKG